MTLLERKGGSVGRKWVYIFNRRNGKKLIPGYSVLTFPTNGAGEHVHKGDSAIAFQVSSSL
jgi:hypothetical protein